MELHHRESKHWVTAGGTILPVGHGCILIVDDEELTVKLEKQMLESLGYEVIAMSSSTDAFEEFHTEPDRFDLVITDMNMPNMTGAELTQRILSVRKNVPVILCTGSYELIDEERAKSIGITEYVTKPFTFERLAKAVFNVIVRKIGQLS